MIDKIVEMKLEAHQKNRDVGRYEITPFADSLYKKLVLAFANEDRHPIIVGDYVGHKKGTALGFYFTCGAQVAFDYFGEEVFCCILGRKGVDNRIYHVVDIKQRGEKQIVDELKHWLITCVQRLS